MKTISAREDLRRAIHDVANITSATSALTIAARQQVYKHVVMIRACKGQLILAGGWLQVRLVQSLRRQPPCLMVQSTVIALI